jgi:hypothetical protein
VRAWNGAENLVQPLTDTHDAKDLLRVRIAVIAMPTEDSARGMHESAAGAGRHSC